MDLKVKNNKIIISHFLNEEDFRRLQDIWMGDIHWIYNDGISDYGDTKDFQFINLVWDSQMAPDPFLWNSLLPVLDYLIPASLIRIKANLRTKTKEIETSSWHNDILLPGSFTAILYINTTDGYTEFKDGDKIQGEENTLVIFPSHMEHFGTSCTNSNRRVIINFNFMPVYDGHLSHLLYTEADRKYSEDWVSR